MGNSNNTNGEALKGVTGNLNSVIKESKIWKFPIGMRFFLVAMSIALIALIVIPFLNIPAYREFNFTLALYVWLVAMIGYSSIFIITEYLKGNWLYKKKKKKK